MKPQNIQSNQVRRIDTAQAFLVLSSSYKSEKWVKRIRTVDYLNQCAKKPSI